MSLLTAFNTQILNFLDDIIKIYPNDLDFLTFKNAIILLKKSNPRKIYQMFDLYIDSYKTQILSRDETFFISECKYNELTDYTEYYKNNSIDISHILDKLKLYWDELSETNKNNIWKYLEVLIKLADMMRTNK